MTHFSIMIKLFPLSLSPRSTSTGFIGVLRIIHATMTRGGPMWVCLCHITWGLSESHESRCKLVRDHPGRMWWKNCRGLMPQIRFLIRTKTDASFTPPSHLTFDWNVFIVTSKELLGIKCRRCTSLMARVDSFVSVGDLHGSQFF